ncbi:MAG: protoporphyrinogen oxidase [Acidobacteriota bacterium]
MYDAAVIGAGISGLSAACRILSAGLSVAVFESESSPGGNMRTARESGYLLERGPHSFLGSSRAIWKLLADVSFLDAVQPATPAARYRYIYRDGRLHALPMSPMQFITTRLLGTRAKLRLLAEPLVPGKASPEDTVETFFARRFGREAATYITGPFVSGIYAGDPSQLGAADSFPVFWELESTSGSLVLGGLRLMIGRRKNGDGPRRHGLFSFGGGLGDLMHHLASRLGPALHLNTPVQSLAQDGRSWRVICEQDVRARAVVVTAPPYEAARMIPGDLAVLLGSMPFVPVAVVHLGSPRPVEGVPRGFGFLIPRHYGIRTLGTVLVSQLFHGRAPGDGTLLTSFLGGAFDRTVLDLSDDELVSIAREDFRRITGVSFPEDFARVVRHPRAIPQLEVGHRKKVTEIHRLAAGTPGLFFAGNYLRGVGMNDAAASGYAAAESAVRYLSESQDHG